MRRGLVTMRFQMKLSVLLLLALSWPVQSAFADRASATAISPAHLRLLRMERQGASPVPAAAAAARPQHIAPAAAPDSAKTPSGPRRVFRPLSASEKAALARSLGRSLMAQPAASGPGDLARLRTLNSLAAPASGASLAAARPLDDNGTTVEPIKEAEPNDDWASAQAIRYGVAVAGEAVPEKDTDIYSFEAAAGDFVRIEARPTGAEGWTSLLLFDPDSNIVTNGLYDLKTISADPTDSRMIMPPIWGGGNVIGKIIQKSGTYRIQVITHPGFIVYLRYSEPALSGESPVSYLLTLDTAPVISLSGKVTGDRGEAVPGAGIAFWSDNFNISSRSESGSDGSFSTGLPEGDYWVTVQSPAGSRYPDNQLSESVRVAADGDKLEFVLKAGVIFSGRTVEDRGPAVAWTNISLADSKSGQYRWATSDSSGRFSVAVFPGTFDIYLYAPWQYPYQPVTEGVPVTTDTSFDLVIATGNRVSGRVLGPDGQAVRYAQILFYGSSDTRFAVSDETGAYQVALLGGKYSVVVTPQTDAGLPEQELGPFSLEADTDLDLKLTAGAQLSGLVQDSNGHPVSGARINLWPSLWVSPDPKGDTLISRDPSGVISQPLINNQGTWTDQSGHWSYAVVPGIWSVEVVAPAPDYPAQAQKAGTYELAEGDRVQVPDVTIDAGVLFSGLVLLPDGTPCRYTSFYMYSGGDIPVYTNGGIVPPSDMPSYNYWAYTDDQGAFQLRVFPAVYRLEFQGRSDANGYPSQRVESVDLRSDRDLKVALDGGWLVSGRVVTPEGQALGGCGLAFYNNMDKFYSTWAWSGPDGQWSVRLLGGDYFVQVQPVEGYFPDSSGLSLSLKADTKFDVTLKPGIWVGGNVTDGNGLGIANVMIHLIDSSPSPLDSIKTLGPVPMPASDMRKETFAADGSVIGSGIIAAGGNFTWSDENGRWGLVVRPGLYDMYVWPPSSYASLFRPLLDLSADLKLTLVLDPASISVSGRVEDENGNPADSVLVSAYDPKSGHHASTWTDAAGRYEFKLPAGRYEIVVDNGQAVSNLEVISDVELTSDKNLNVRFGTGVVDGNGEPAPGLPKAFALAQNTPNPFNPSTSIQYSLASDSHVRLAVFDIRGRLLATLVDRDRSAGSYSVQWDGRDSSGRTVSSGVYFYRMDTDSFSRVRKMVLLK